MNNITPLRNFNFTLEVGEIPPFLICDQLDIIKNVDGESLSITAYFVEAVEYSSILDQELSKKDISAKLTFLDLEGKPVRTEVFEQLVNFGWVLSYDKNDFMKRKVVFWKFPKNE